MKKESNCYSDIWTGRKSTEEGNVARGTVYKSGKRSNSKSRPLRFLQKFLVKIKEITSLVISNRTFRKYPQISMIL